MSKMIRCKKSFAKHDAWIPRVRVQIVNTWPNYVIQLSFIHRTMNGQRICWKTKTWTFNLQGDFLHSTVWATGTFEKTIFAKKNMPLRILTESHSLKWKLQRNIFLRTKHLGFTCMFSYKEPYNHTKSVRPFAYPWLVLEIVSSKKNYFA